MVSNITRSLEYQKLPCFLFLHICTTCNWVPSGPCQRSCGPISRGLLPTGAHSPFPVSCFLCVPPLSSKVVLQSPDWICLLLSPAPLLHCELLFTLFLTLVTFSDKIALCIKTHPFCNTCLITPLETSSLLSGLIAYILLSEVIFTF